MYVFPDETEYNCDNGHSTTGKADGAKSFQATCEANGEIHNVLSCQPVACPEIPRQTRAEYSEDVQLVFPEKIAVTCDKSFALNEHQHQDVTYEISCEADGALKFSTEDKCQPISCGGLPEVAHAGVEGPDRFGEYATVISDERR